MLSPPWINKPPPLIKSRGARKSINAKHKYQEILISANKQIQLGVILGVILGMLKSAPGLRGSTSVTFD